MVPSGICTSSSELQRRSSSSSSSSPEPPVPERRKRLSRGWIQREHARNHAVRPLARLERRGAVQAYLMVPGALRGDDAAQGAVMDPSVFDMAFMTMAACIPSMPPRMRCSQPAGMSNTICIDASGQGNVVWTKTEQDLSKF